MTPNPTSEPELETNPVAVSDPPKPSTEAVTSEDAASEPTAEAGAEAEATKAVPVEATKAVPVDETKVVPVDAETTPVAETVSAADAAPVVEPAEENVPVEPVAAADETEVVPVDETTPVQVEPVTEAPAAQTVPVLPISAEPAPVEPAPAETASVGPEVLALGEPEAAEDDDDRIPPTRNGGYDTLFPLAGALLGLTALISLLIAAFALPAVHSGPNHVPIGVAGPASITPQLKQIFTQANADAFDVKVYTQESQLKKAIEHHVVYGGLSVTTTGASMLISSAASPTIAEQLGGLASTLTAQTQTQIAVSDVVPLPTKDPRGNGLNSLALPLVIGSLLPALLMFQVYRRRVAAQIAASLGASVLIGLAVSAILTFWIGATHGANYWLLTLGLAAGVAATSLILLGLAALGGRIALGIGAAVVLLLGAPLSGFSTAPEWISSPWGTIGQLLPPGASGTVLRTFAFFDGHGSGPGLLVLGGWALIGLLLIVLGTALIPPTETIYEEDNLIEIDLTDAEASGSR
jgi:hypothetical protein